MFDRPKSGFNVPLQDWLRGPLKDWAEDLLSHNRLKEQNLLDTGLVSARWKDFKEGRDVHANASDIWSVLMFQAWYERWMK
jgi:asparagine synthase (glutamine-hydrolysing)